MARANRVFVVVGALLAASACGGGGGFPDAQVHDTAPPKAAFSVTWSVTDAQGAALPCDQIGAQTVTVLAHNRAYDGGFPEVFSCATGSGTSEALPAGIYDLQFELVGPGGMLATAPQQVGVVIPAGTTTPLMPLTFSVDATGALALQLSSGATGGNCAATSAMGAGITGTTITLVRDRDGACEPLALQISAGASGTAGTYMIDCTTPVQTGCLNADQTLSAAGVPSDAYTIHVTGLVGPAPGTACWLNNDTLQVPAAGNTLTSTLHLAHQTAPGC